MVHQERPACERKFLDKNYNRKEELSIKMVNIQGLTKAKSVEVVELLKEKQDKKCIMCLVETQQKYRNVDYPKEILFIDKMREFIDKKGGGLSLLMFKKEGWDLKEKQCDNPDF